MAAFRFRFEAVLRHRRLEEQKRLREMAVIERERRAIEEAIEACSREMGAGQQFLRGVLGGALDIPAIRLQMAAAGSLESRARRLGQELEHVNGRLEEARGRLMKAVVARKGVERLREREYEAWRTRCDRAEAMELDERSIMQAGRGS